eukprot:8425309-Pyramimonas_sp.AAC.1
MLRVVIHGALKHMKERWPSLSLHAMVDDITSSPVGSANRVRVVSGKVIPDLRRQLENMEMVASKKKCQIMASSLQVSEQLGKALKRHRSNVWAAAKARLQSAVQQREKVSPAADAKLRRRAHRSRASKHHRRGLARAYRGGGIAAATHRARAMGASDKELKNLRRIRQTLILLCWSTRCRFPPGS